MHGMCEQMYLNMFGTQKQPKTMQKYENKICLMKCLCENWICTLCLTKCHN